MKIKYLYFGCVALTLSAGIAAADPLEDCRSGASEAIKLAACTSVINNKSSVADYLDIAYSERGQISCRAGDKVAAMNDFEKKPRAAQGAMRRAKFHYSTASDTMSEETRSALRSWIEKRCAHS